MANGAMFTRFLDTNGDGSGTKNANVDGSGTPQVFKIVPTRSIAIARMIVHIEDAGAIAGGNYGAVAALANGVEVGIYTVDGDALVTDLLDGLDVQTNAQWARFCYDVSNITFASGNNYVNVRWTFAKSGAAVNVTPDKYFAVTVNDNLTGLVDHTFIVQGRYADV